MTWKYTELAC